MSDNVSTLSVDLLVSELYGVTEWYTLGAFLGLTENEIKEIEQDHHETARRRMAMISKWLKKETNPSWQKVISALEKMSEMSLANQLREKYGLLPTMTSEPSQLRGSADANKPLPVMRMDRKELIVRKLEEVEERYLELIVVTESALEDINPPQSKLRRFSTFYTSVRVTTVVELLDCLEQFCFLDYTLLEKIISFFLKKQAPFVVNDLDAYVEHLEKFKSSTTLQHFMESIEKAQHSLTTTNGGIETCTVVLYLVGGWLEKTVNDLDKLLKELFQDKQSVLSHIQIVRGSVIATYCAPQWEAESLVSLVLQTSVSIPLHRVGIFRLTVAETVVFNTQYDESFSFESSLLSAVFTDGKLLSFLLDINVNPDVSMQGIPALFAAIIARNNKTVELLLQANANPDLYYRDTKMTPLAFVAKRKDQKTAELLLKANANTDIQDIEGATPLHYSCENDDVDITDLLLKAGASCNLEDNSGKAPLHIASMYGYSGIVDLLLRANSSSLDLQSNIGGFTALFIACYRKHIDVIRLLLRANANPNLATYNNGMTPLFMACELKNANIVRILLDANADPNLATYNGMAPLNLASNHGHLEIIKLLLNANADLDHQSDKILTPLMFACLNRKPETVRLLLSRGADPNIQHSVTTFTALMCACYSGCLDSVELLLMSGADLDKLNQKDLSALDIAASKGHEDIVNLIQAVNLSQSSTTSPVLTATEIATNLDNEAMSLLNKAMENVLVAKSEKLITAHFKHISKRILPSQESSQTLT